MTQGVGVGEGELMNSYNRTPIKAVLFDVFGTLLDASTDDYLSPFSHLVAPLNLGVDDQIMLSRMFSTTCLPTIDDAADKIEIMFGDREISVAARQAAISELEQDLARTLPVNGVFRLLPALRNAGVRIALVSNLAQPYEKAIHRHKIDKLADVLIYSFEVGYRKPEREIYEIALARLGVAAECAVMIGDCEVADGEGPRSLGIRTRLVQEGFGDNGVSLNKAVQWVLKQLPDARDA